MRPAGKARRPRIPGVFEGGATHWAAMNGDAELAQTLLFAGANVRATTRIGAYTPLILAAKNGGAAVMEPLLKAGADVNTQTSNGTTALMLAASSGSTDAVTLLIDRGADLKATSKVTDLAALSRDEQALRAFTTGNPAPPGEPPAGGRSGPASGGRGARPQQVAGVDRSYQLNELVAAQGGLTPLLLAAREGHRESVEALLSAGADLNQPSAGDRTSPLL